MGRCPERHLEYAERIGHLHMVVYSPLASDLHTTKLSDHLTVYPTRSRTRLNFVLDAVRIGAEVCREHPVNVITTQDPFTTGLAGWWLKRQFKIPLDVQNHSDFFDNRYWIAERPLRYGVFNALGKWIVKRGDTHRVLNEIEKAKVVGLGIDADRVVVLSTPVRLGRFTPDAAPGEATALRKSLGIPPDAPTLLWVGRPGPVKRVEMLVDAFASVHKQRPDARLILVGDFAARDDIREQVVQLNLNEAVCFPGEIAHDELPAYYRLADLYVHSSVYEGLGKVLIEAAACGVPSVSTHTAGAAAIIIDGETGILTPLHDIEKMAVPDYRSAE